MVSWPFGISQYLEHPRVEGTIYGYFEAIGKIKIFWINAFLEMILRIIGSRISRAQGHSAHFCPRDNLNRIVSGDLRFPLRRGFPCWKEGFPMASTPSK